MYGKEYHTNAKAMVAIGDIPIGQINCSEFVTYVRAHPSVMIQPELLQSEMRNSVVDEKFWRLMMKRKSTICEDKVTLATVYAAEKLLLLYPPKKTSDINQDQNGEGGFNSSKTENNSEISRKNCENNENSVKIKKMKRSPYRNILNKRKIDKEFFPTDRDRDISNAKKKAGVHDIENEELEVVNIVIKSYQSEKLKSLKNVRNTKIS